MRKQSGFAVLALIIALTIAGVTGAVIENNEDVIKNEQTK
jgi:uncharacterized membrane protein